MTMSAGAESKPGASTAISIVAMMELGWRSIDGRKEEERAMDRSQERNVVIARSKMRE
jgi:hypothetical protein